MERPCVLIVATGGTLAGTSDNPLATTGYKDASLGIDELLRTIPNVSEIARCKTHTLCAVGSENISSPHLVDLSRLVNLSSESPEVDGIVITHGSDTLEETSFFLESTYNGTKPVVVVSSLRPSTSVSADGPCNLIQAIALAASPSARNRGVLVTWSNRIASAVYSSKFSNRAIDAYQTPDQGCLGVLVDLNPTFYFAPSRATGRFYVDLSEYDLKGGMLPKVPILYGHQEMDVDILRLVVSHGIAAGVVVACTGDGTLPITWEEAARELGSQGVPVVRSSRVLASYIAPRKDALTAGYHSPVKARIILQLLLLTSALGPDIQKAFSSE